jgi:DNA-binding IclR family transcriptional regulator
LWASSFNDAFFYIDKRERESILRIPSYLGAKIPPTESFLGLTLFAFQDPSERKRVLKQYPFRKHTERTPTRLSQVQARLEDAGHKEAIS